MFVYRYNKEYYLQRTAERLRNVSHDTSPMVPVNNKLSPKTAPKGHVSREMSKESKL